VRRFASPDELLDAVGQHLGESDWVVVDQARVEAYAAATGSADLGLLVLSLIAAVIDQVFSVEGQSYSVNYGCNLVRFPAPVRAGMRVRAAATLSEATVIPGGVHVVTGWRFKAEGIDEPVCVAQTVTRYYSRRPAQS
jgi:acyl dehydratase